MSCTMACNATRPPQTPLTPIGSEIIVIGLVYSVLTIVSPALRTTQMVCIPQRCALSDLTSLQGMDTYRSDNIVMINWDVRDYIEFIA
jgi:hypothetical protein